MMAEKMSVAQARAIARELRTAYAKHGAQLRSPYKQHQIIEALSTMLTQEETVGNDTMIAARDMVSAANRRAGAAESRLKRCMGKAGEPGSTEQD